ncbi:MAG: COG4315 family predicted lipoprotein [Thermoleophilaceae bacterium]
MLAGAAVLAAGCGSGGGGSSSVPATTQANGAVVLSSSNTATLGKILTAGNGRTLYLFMRDTGPSSTCSGECAANWPPLTTTATPTAGAGVSAAEIKTTRRSDGKMQVVFNGHPLYYYAGDNTGGDLNGEGLNAFGGAWYALSPAGKQLTRGSSSRGSYGGY